MTQNATSFCSVATKTGVWKRARVEWDSREVGTGWIRTVVAWIDDGCKESNLIAGTLFYGTLGTLMMEWKIVGWAANAPCAIDATVKCTKIFSETTTFGQNGECAWHWQYGGKNGIC